MSRDQWCLNCASNCSSIKNAPQVPQIASLQITSVIFTYEILANLFHPNPSISRHFTNFDPYVNKNPNELRIWENLINIRNLHYLISQY